MASESRSLDSDEDDLAFMKAQGEHESIETSISILPYESYEADPEFLGTIS